jgi:hypothetical protein
MQLQNKAKWQGESSWRHGGQRVHPRKAYSWSAMSTVEAANTTNIENESKELAECDFTFGFSSPFQSTQLAVYFFGLFLYLCVSSCIFLYLYVSFCIFTYLYVSLRIFMYLYVSFCFWRIFTYLYVSFKTVQEDTYVSLRIFIYLSKPFRKIRTYLYVSLSIFWTGFERYIKIRKDT